MSNTEPIGNPATTPPADATQLPRYISRHQAATDCGVTRGAVIRWIKEGKVDVVADRDRIDRFSADYLYCKQKAKAKKESVGPTAPRPHKAKSSAPKPQSKRIKPRVEETQRLYFGTKQDADIAKIREQIMSLQLKNESLRNELVPRDTVKRVFNELYSVESTEMLSIGDRLSPEIAAMGGIDKPEIVIAIGQLIRNEVARSLDHIDTIFDRFLSGIALDERAPEVEMDGGNDDCE